MALLKSFKNTVSLVVAMILLLSSITTAWAAQASSDDLQGHWAETQMRQWVEQGLLKGDNSAYYPNRSITRAELITFINRAFKLSEPTEIYFKDLSNSHWAYEQVAIAVKAGYVSGFDDKTIRINKNVTREEAAVMVAKLLKLASTNLTGLERFKDTPSISSWSKSAIQALVDVSILRGNEKGNIMPQGKLTRAEAVTMLQKAMDYTSLNENSDSAIQDRIYNTAGVYGPTTGIETIKGNVTISAPGVKLQNVVIEGNLTFTKDVGEGDAFLHQVTVKGTTTIQGGGSDSVHIEDAILSKLSVEKQSGTVRVVTAGATSIQTVVVHSSVKLEESNVTDSGFTNIELAKDLATGAEVQLIGQFENVNVLSSNSKITLVSGSAKQVAVAADSLRTEINVQAKASIKELILKAAATVIGEGRIEKAVISSDAKTSTFQTRPTTIEEAASVPAVAPVAPPATGGGAPVSPQQPSQPAPNPGQGQNPTQPEQPSPDPGEGQEPTQPEQPSPDPGEGQEPTQPEQPSPNPGEGQNPEPEPSPNPDDPHDLPPSPGEGNAPEAPLPPTSPEDQPSDGGQMPPIFFPTCKEETVECSALKLVDLNVSGFIMNQLDSSDYSTGVQGFNSNVTQYSIVTERDMPGPVKAALTVKKSSAATLYYYVIETGRGVIKSGLTSNADNSFEFDISPMKDMNINIYVTGYGFQKLYQISIQYPRTIQEAFRVAPLSGSTGSTKYYLQKGTLSGEKLSGSDSVLMFEEGATTPFLSCSYFCPIPDENVKEDKGVWFIEVYRNNTLLSSGEYHYDLSTAPVITTDIGLKVRPLGKEELLEFTGLRCGYSVDINTTKLFAVPGVKYVAVRDEDMSGTVTTYPRGLNFEDLKTGIDPIQDPGSSIYFMYSGMIPRPMRDLDRLYPVNYFRPSMNLFKVYSFQQSLGPKTVSDKFFYFGLYDENFKLIGQYITVLTFDQDHVADGYIAEQNWQPAP